MGDENLENEFAGTAGEAIPQVILENQDLIDQTHRVIRGIGASDYPGSSSIYQLASDLDAPAPGDDGFGAIMDPDIDDEGFEDKEFGGLAALLGASLEEDDEVDLDEVDLGDEELNEEFENLDKDLEDIGGRRGLEALIRVSLYDEDEEPKGPDHAHQTARELNAQGLGGNAATELRTLLSHPCFKKYQDKFGDMLAKHPEHLHAPALFSDIIPEYLGDVLVLDEYPESPKIHCEMLEILSKNELFMTCLEQSEHLQGMMMHSLSNVQTFLNMDFSVDEKKAYFEACAKSGILEEIINAQNINPHAVEQENDADVEYEGSDREERMEKAGINYDEFLEAMGEAMSREIDVPFQRENLITFLDYGFSGVNEEAAKEMLEKTGVLNDLVWDEDIERWTHEFDNSIAAAVLEVCQKNRSEFLAKNTGISLDDFDISSS